MEPGNTFQLLGLVEILPGLTQLLFFLPWLLCKRNLAKQVVLISVPETHIPSCTTIHFPIIPTSTPLFIIFLWNCWFDSTLLYICYSAEYSLTDSIDEPF